MTHYRITCKGCGEEIKAASLGKLLEKETKHLNDCHPGFTYPELLDENGDPVDNSDEIKTVADLELL